jgi:hypothetical protein
MNSEIDLSENRFEKLFQRARGNKKKFFIILLLALVLLETSISSAYLLRRISNDHPVIDILERFYVLRPLTLFFFKDQYRFPESISKNYTGENSLPKNAGNLFKADSLRGYVTNPNTVVSMMTYYWSATNSQGLHLTEARNPTKIYEIPKPSNVFRIIVIGGSTVAGNGSADQYEALPSLLQKILREEYLAPTDESKKIEVINGGVGGYYSELEILHYLSSLRKLQPDLVISYNGANDITITNDKLQKYGLNADRFLSKTHQRNNQILYDYFKFWPTLTRTLSLAVESLYHFLDGFSIIHISVRAIRKITFPVEFDEVEQNKLGGQRVIPYHEESVKRYIENMELLLLINQLDGTKTAWFMQPLVGLGTKPPAEGREKHFVTYMQNHVRRRRAFYATATDGMRELMLKYNNPRTFCAASLANVFDGNPAGVFEDSGHLIASGNLIVARKLSEELARCGIVAKRLN